VKEYIHYKQLLDRAKTVGLSLSFDTFVADTCISIHWLKGKAVPPPSTAGIHMNVSGM
jgi:hypothetical protein